MKKGLLVVFFIHLKSYYCMMLKCVSFGGLKCHSKFFSNSSLSKKIVIICNSKDIFLAPLKKEGYNSIFVSLIPTTGCYCVCIGSLIKK